MQKYLGFMSGKVPSLVAAFEDEFRKPGYIDGRNVHLVMRLAELASRMLDWLAAELEALGRPMATIGGGNDA